MKIVILFDPKKREMITAEGRRHATACAIFVLSLFFFLYDDSAHDDKMSYLSK